MHAYWNHCQRADAARMQSLLLTVGLYALQEEEAWRVPHATLTVLTRALRPGEDAIFQVRYSWSIDPPGLLQHRELDVTIASQTPASPRVLPADSCCCRMCTSPTLTSNLPSARSVPSCVRASKLRHISHSHSERQACTTDSHHADWPLPCSHAPCQPRSACRPGSACHTPCQDPGVDIVKTSVYRSFSCWSV